ncbi:MAG: cupin domain-containing protein [Chloroflexi bacterium]|nr:cupin domain-containing protein [Chloroflexota bacterium]
MKVVNLNEIVPDWSGGEIFLGKVGRQSLVTEQMAGTLRLAAVTFSPGVRTKLHTHTHDQILYCIAGRGILATEHERHLVTPGMAVYVPPGERHTHGATEDSFFTHLSITTQGRSDIVE